MNNLADAGRPGARTEKNEPQSLRLRMISKKLNSLESALSAPDVRGPIHELELIVREFPNHLCALELLAQGLWKLGNLDRLLQVLDQMIGLNPLDPNTHAIKGSAQQLMGDFGGACRSFMEAMNLKKSPDATLAALLAEAQSRQDEMVTRKADSDVIFRRLLHTNPAAAYESLGFAYNGGVRVTERMPRGYQRINAARPS